MIKRIILLGGFLALCFMAQAQAKAKKLTKEEAANKTQEQRLVQESNRKSKHGKKDLSIKKKVHMGQKQDRRARHTKAPKN